MLGVIFQQKNFSGSHQPVSAPLVPYPLHLFEGFYDPLIQVVTLLRRPSQRRNVDRSTVLVPNLVFHRLIAC
jgi:hypothetical protein